MLLQLFEIFKSGELSTTCFHDPLVLLFQNIKGTDLLKTHVSGVISHGHGGFHTFVDINEYRHDPNLTINILLKMLKRMADEHVCINQ